MFLKYKRKKIIFIQNISKNFLTIKILLISMSDGKILLELQSLLISNQCESKYGGKHLCSYYLQRVYASSNKTKHKS
jgi:hypothetical protein